MKTILTALFALTTIVVTPMADVVPTLTRKGDHYHLRNPRTVAVNVTIFCGTDYQNQVVTEPAGCSEVIKLTDPKGKVLDCSLLSWEEVK